MVIFTLFWCFLCVISNKNIPICHCSVICIFVCVCVCVKQPCWALMSLRNLAFCWQWLSSIPYSYTSEWNEMKRVSFHSSLLKNAVGCLVLIVQIIWSRWAPYGFPYIKTDLCWWNTWGWMWLKWNLINLLCLTYTWKPLALFGCKPAMIE